MARTVNAAYRAAKEKQILESARQVFCRKGYLNTTMQDIIDECGISRGGIYLYFKSVAEIFQAVVSGRSKARSCAVQAAIAANEPFAAVLADFLAQQKVRLLHMENSLLRAMYEYTFSRAKGATPAFRNAQLANLRGTVQAILALGIAQGALRDENTETLADHFIVVIEGLGVMALVDVLTEAIADEQFEVLTAMVRERGRT